MVSSVPIEWLATALLRAILSDLLEFKTLRGGGASQRGAVGRKLIVWDSVFQAGIHFTLETEEIRIDVYSERHITNVNVW